MNASLGDLIFYVIGIFLLFITPGPVQIAIVARSMINGVCSAWPLAFGVSLEDILWQLTAILGLSLIAGASGEYLVYLKWLAAVIFSLWISAGNDIMDNSIIIMERNLIFYSQYRGHTKYNIFSNICGTYCCLIIDFVFMDNIYPFMIIEKT